MLFFSSGCLPMFCKTNTVAPAPPVDGVPLDEPALGVPVDDEAAMLERKFHHMLSGMTFVKVLKHGILRDAAVFSGALPGSPNAAHAAAYYRLATFCDDIMASFDNDYCSLRARASVTVEDVERVTTSLVQMVDEVELAREALRDRTANMRARRVFN